MKPIRLITLTLLVSLLSFNSTQAQLLKKLKKRVQAATEDVIVDKVAEKAAQETGKAMDSLLQIDPDYQPYSQAQLEQFMVQDSVDFPMEATYEFNTRVTYQMEFSSKDNSSIVDYGMWFSENENYMATQVKNIKSKEKNQQDMPASMLSVIDEKNKIMIIFMEDQKMAQVLSMEKIKEISVEENEAENTNTDFEGLKKTGQTKKILGYNCEEFAAVNNENNFSIWITDELELFQKNMFYSINESLGGKTFKNIPKDAKGFMMETHFENLVNGEKGKMIVTEINKQSKSINTSEYQYMNLSQFMQK
jgi:hypothetical protein